MNIVTVLTGILETMRLDTLSPLKSWQYNSPGRANVELDTSEPPTAVIYCLTDWQLTQTIVRERARVAVGFLTLQPDIDFDGISNEAKIDTCKDIALDFIARVSDDGRLGIISDPIDVRSVYDDHDRNLTGVFVEFECRETQGACLDNYIPEPEPETTPDEP
jgi:hypothetical protein